MKRRNKTHRLSLDSPRTPMDPGASVREKKVLTDQSKRKLHKFVRPYEFVNLSGRKKGFIRSRKEDPSIRPSDAERTTGVGSTLLDN